MSENSSNQSRRRGKRRRNILYAPLSFVLICAVMFFGMSVFFRVSIIEVSGSEVYSDEEVIEASGLEEGDNLLFVNRSLASTNIFSRLPYIDKVSIERKLPNRIVIEITESSAVACVFLQGEPWVMNKRCKLLGPSAYDAAGEYIVLLGVTPVAPAAGEVLTVNSDETPKVEYAAAILQELADRGMRENVTWLDLSNVGSPSFDYLGRFTVRLGTNENIKYKFDLLKKAVEQLAEGDAGTIDLSGERQAQFLPE